ncbi:MAG: indolepyruvate oxidoreductase subunit beta [Clostridia bacterium]|nr:indolepyruvate oxidoreductase subunit beta [Clostridia bacterium]
MTKSIMIVGVGGQGTLLASRILGHAILSKGFDVKISEVHGMSQRGGSVVTYVKYNTTEKVASPIICPGEADIILAFERLEAARYLEYLKPEGRILVNSQKLNPIPVITGQAEYPDDILDKFKELKVEYTAVDALGIANEAGSSKAVNVALIGLLAKNMDIDYGTWINSIRACVPSRFVDINLKAFEHGYNY